MSTDGEDLESVSQDSCRRKRPLEVPIRALKTFRRKCSEPSKNIRTGITNDRRETGGHFMFNQHIPIEYHDKFMALILEEGLRSSSPKILMGLLPPIQGLTTGHIKPRLQKFRRQEHQPECLAICRTDIREAMMRDLRTDFETRSTTCNHPQEETQDITTTAKPGHLPWDKISESLSEDCVSSDSGDFGREKILDDLQEAEVALEDWTYMFHKFSVQKDLPQFKLAENASQFMDSIREATRCSSIIPTQQPPP